MVFPETAALTAAILMILQIVLMLSVGMHRFKVKVGVGTGEDPDLERKIRRHGNLAENAAVFLVTLTLAELAGAAALPLQALAALFVVARTCHVIAFTSQSGSHQPNGSVFFPMMRASGAFGTAIAGIGLGVLLLTSLI